MKYKNYTRLILFMIVLLYIQIFLTNEISAFNPSGWDAPKDADLAATSGTHAKGGYYKDIQEPAITVEKYIEGISGVCNKHDAITVRLRVLNCDLTNKLKGLYVIEEIPKGFKLIRNASTPGFQEKNDPSRIEWYVGDQDEYIGKFYYALEAIESGPHIIPSTVIRTTIIDKNGREYRIQKSSDNDISVLVGNRAPEIKVDPESPIKKWFVYNLTEINIEVFDPDNDLLKCELIPMSNKTITMGDDSYIDGIYKCMWILPNDQKATYILRAYDGTDSSEKEIILEPYVLPEWIQNILGAIIIASMTWIVSRIKCENEKKMKRKKQRRLEDYYNVFELKKP